jgi:hypothetical protein
VIAPARRRTHAAAAAIADTLAQPPEPGPHRRGIAQSLSRGAVGLALLHIERAPYDRAAVEDPGDEAVAWRHGERVTPRRVQHDASRTQLGIELGGKRGRAGLPGDSVQDVHAGYSLVSASTIGIFPSRLQVQRCVNARAPTAGSRRGVVTTAQSG